LLSDFLIFIGGTALGALIALLSGFAKAAGNDLYQILKKKISPPPVEPIQVERSYEPEKMENISLSWVSEESIVSCESKGYMYHVHPIKGARCYRLVRSGSGNQFKEWLMKKPK
jgi:hypothetical protein